MQHNARVKRTFNTAEHRYMPTDIVDAETLASWPQQNVRALVSSGFMELIEVHGDADTTELRAQNMAQAERIRELEALLKDNDLMFDASKHMTKFGQPVQTRGGKFRRKTRS